MGEKHKQEALHLINECEEEAEEILENNKLLLLKLSEYLTANHKIEEAGIADFVMKYATARWIKEEGFKKKENYFSFESMLKKQITNLKV